MEAYKFNLEPVMINESCRDEGWSKPFPNQIHFCTANSANFLKFITAQISFGNGLDQPLFGGDKDFQEGVDFCVDSQLTPRI